MNKTVPFAVMRSLLESLGFKVWKAKGGYTLAKHAASGCELRFPAYQVDEGVTLVHQAATRHFLDVFGVLDKDRFDEELHRAMLAG
ncbi:MAG: hypothetical protein K2W96_25135 [Gemmataceae bacterium]|nr:hypothetical protein [Gemmataceae bacterium]